MSVEELAAAGEVPGVASEGDDDVAMPDQADATSASAKSVKIVALVEHLARTRADDPGRKCVVFSHFTSFLDRIGTELAAQIAEHTSRQTESVRADDGCEVVHSLNDPRAIELPRT